MILNYTKIRVNTNWASGGISTFIKVSYPSQTIIIYTPFGSLNYISPTQIKDYYLQSLSTKPNTLYWSRYKEYHSTTSDTLHSPRWFQ